MNNQIAINPPVVFTPTQPIFNQPVKEITVSELTLRSTQDDPTLQQVRATFFETPYPLVLWDGADYASIGQYTDTQINARVGELLSKDTAVVVESLFAPPVRIDPTLIRARYQERFGKNPVPRPVWVSPVSAPVHTTPTLTPAPTPTPTPAA